MIDPLVLNELAGRILSVERPHPVRVAIDGIDAAGKTTLADALVDPIQQGGRPVIRASVDGYHRPRRDRYRRGKDSPLGYYEDSFDYAALRDDLLRPLGPDGSRHYRRVAFDFQQDAPVYIPWEVAPENAILLFDGVFLLRPELDDLWDFRIVVNVDFQVALTRAIARDAALFGSETEVEDRYRRRYFPAQHHYLWEERPQQRADVVVDGGLIAGRDGALRR